MSGLDNNPGAVGTQPGGQIARTGATELVDGLIRAGVREVFGVPGDTGVALYDAFYHRSESLRHILARDERHAVAMADGYARVTGRPAVAEVSSGGGATYAVGGLGEAFAAGIPMVLLVSDIHTDSRGSGALTETDLPALFKAVTKQQIVVRSADDAAQVVTTALAVACAGRPAPVAVIVPENILDQEASGSTDGATTTLPSAPALPNSSELDAAAQLLTGASKPAIYAGGGVHMSRAYDALARLASSIGAGVATSIHGKGAVADTHPCSLGVAGNNGGSEATNAYLSGADVVLFVGTRANATDTDSFTAPPRSATIIGIDIEPDRAGRNYPGALRLVGDADAILVELGNRIKDVGEPIVEQRLSAVAEARAERRVDDHVRPAAGVLLASDVVTAVHESCNGRAVVVGDPGTPTPFLAQWWHLDRPGRRVVTPRGHGPMGYAIPAAIGAAIAHAGEPVIAFTADGSFAMCCGELETIARYQLPIVIIQMTNNSLGWIKMLQHLYMGGRYFGVDPGPIDAVAVAKACGMRGIHVTTLAELRQTVISALTDRQAVYIDVQVPHMMDVVPPVAAWRRALAGDTSRPVY